MCDPEYDYEDRNAIYKFCKLTKGSLIQQTWIPEDFAVKNKIIKIRDPQTGIWDNGWKVESCGSLRNSSGVLDAMQDQVDVLFKWKKRDYKLRQAQSRVDSRYCKRKSKN